MIGCGCSMRRKRGWLGSVGKGESGRGWSGVAEERWGASSGTAEVKSASQVNAAGILNEQ